MRLVLVEASAILATLAGMAGCAGGWTPPTGEGQEYRDAPEVTTGSNLPRRDRSKTAAREVDKDAIETGLRSTTRNTGQ